MAFQIFLVKIISAGNENYELRNFTDISINKSTPISPMPLPEEDSEENVLIKIEGNTTTISLDWKIVPLIDNYGFSTGVIVWNTTNLRFQGTTAVGGSNDILPQMKKLIKMVPSKITDSYRIQVYEQKSTGTADLGLNIKGLPQGISFRTDSSSPVVWGAHMDFTEGSVISSLSINLAGKGSITGTPSFTLSGSTRTGFTVSITEYQGYATGDRITVTGAVLRYKAVDGVNSSFWLEKEISVTQNTSTSKVTAPYTNQSFPISNLDTTGSYYIKFAFVTAGGRSPFSDEKTVS